MERLTQALLAGTRAQGGGVKLPKYRGDSDVELFITQFIDVQLENDWGNRSSLLHLRGALEGPAVECGRGETVREVLDHLRAQFGLTKSGAKEELAHIRRGTGESIHSLGVRVERLTKVAYAGRDAATQMEWAVDATKRALSSPSLNQFFLTVPTRTVAEVVTAAQEFYRAGRRGPTPQGRHQLSALDETDSSEPTVESAAGLTANDPEKSALEAMLKSMEANNERMLKALETTNTLMAQIATQVASGGRPAPGQPARIPRGSPSQNNRQFSNQPSVKTNACYHCGTEGHFRRNCPKLAGNDRRFQ